MSERLARTVEELRRAFDASFAAAPELERPPEVAFLALRVGAEVFAVRLLDTAGLVPARRVVRVPSPDPALLGITGLRGAIVPVYSLAVLLGRHGLAEDAPWYLTCGRDAGRVALAFTQFEGHVRAALSDLRAAQAERPGREHVSELLTVGDVVRPVLDVGSLMARITGEAGGVLP